MYKFEESQINKGQINKGQINKGQINIGISSCVLGQEVRYNGGHKRSAFCVEQMSEYVQFVPVCPEVAIGLGVPRPTIRLERHGEDVIASTSEGENVTERLKGFGRDMAGKLGFISGYVFCAKSPSCGMERVKVYKSPGGASKEGGLLFAEELMKAMPLLPAEEDGRLNDPALRENFVARIYAYHDWQTMVADGLAASKLTSFHARYKYMLLAHSPLAYNRLGRLTSDLSCDLEKKAESYIEGFMEALKTRASRKNHCNVLMHLQGYFKKQLSSCRRQELAEVIHKYRQGIVPLMAPLMLLKHCLAEYPNDYVAQQRYLNPYPEPLALRYGL